MAVNIHRHVQAVPTLTITGLSLLTAAAWTIAVVFGLVAAGLACIVLAWLVGDDA